MVSENVPGVSNGRRTQVNWRYGVDSAKGYKNVAVIMTRDKSGINLLTDKVESGSNGSVILIHRTL